MDEIIRFFTSFRGRISRRYWWYGIGLLVALSMVGETFWPREPIWVGTIWQLLLIFPTTAITVKRFNDRDWPNWLGYAVGLIIALFTIGPHFGFFFSKPMTMADFAMCAIGPHCGFSAAGPLIITDPIAVFVFAIPLTFAVIANGFLRGTRGPNRYGPEPQPLWA